MKFEWDQNKDIANQNKHGLSFNEAIEIFEDPLHISILDDRYSYFEERWITVGMTKGDSIVVAANLYFDEKGEEVIRIISAREATNNEKRKYEGK